MKKNYDIFALFIAPTLQSASYSYSSIWDIKNVFSSFTPQKLLIQAGCSQESIKVVEEAAAILQFCLRDEQHTGVTSLDDTCNRKYIVVECEGKYVCIRLYNQHMNGLNCKIV